MRLATTEEMRRLEQAAVDAGDTWAGLMERAGQGVAREALRVLGTAAERHVLVLVGPGNNGGDGLVAARHLHDAGARVSLAIWRRTESDDDANWRHCRERDIPQQMLADEADLPALNRLLERADLVIDALLGMGVSRPVEGLPAAIVGAVEQHPRRAAFHVLAIDVPTGIQSDSGAVLGAAVRADTTVATGLPKRGLLLYPGRASVGTLALAEIDIPPDAMEIVMSETISREQASSLLPARPADAHKGTFGKVMVVAGSWLYPGASALATAGAGRVGAGLVTLATARSILGNSARSPEVTLLPLHEASAGTIDAEAADTLHKNLEGYAALLVGPGLGREKPTGMFLRRLLGMEQPRRLSRVGFRVQELAPDAEPSKSKPEHRSVSLPPTVLDADALNLLSEIDDWAEHLSAEQFVLTPHPGEMRRLLGTDDLASDVVQVATDAAKQWQQVVVFKGATTVVAAPDGRSAVHADGNPALATAGTGDVLAGAIAGLLAQGLALYDAAVLGVYLHSAAGALLRDELGETGTLASDLLIRLPRTLKELR
jgi:NAD(P)H-hydrate epimerase